MQKFLVTAGLGAKFTASCPFCKTVGIGENPLARAVLTKSRYIARSRRVTIHSALTPRITCQPSPHSLDALDLSSSSPAAAFAALHDHVLSCLADIEASLSQLESPLPDFDLGQAISRSELKVEEVQAWVKDGLEILK